MSTAYQRGIVTRQTEAEVLRMIVGGTKQLAVSRQLGLSKGTVSKLVNGVHKFSPSSGEPHPELPRLRDAIAKQSMQYHMEQCMSHLRQFAIASGVAA